LRGFDHCCLLLVLGFLFKKGIKGHLPKPAAIERCLVGGWLCLLRTLVLESFKVLLVLVGLLGQFGDNFRVTKINLNSRHRRLFI
jgi:hypothetical protein